MKRTLRPRKPLKAIPGFVWCARHGEVHEDFLDPYGYGPLSELDQEKGFEDLRCVPADHIKVYARISE